MHRYVRFLPVIPMVLAWALILLAPIPARGDGHGGHASGHGHGKPMMMPRGPEAPALRIAIAKDPVDGWNLHVATENFRFAPERASKPHHPGEGHAHLYVNGKKWARLYGPWFHIGRLPAGRVAIRVTLNTNDHREIMVGGTIVAATRVIEVPAPNP